MKRRITAVNQRLIHVIPWLPDLKVGGVGFSLNFYIYGAFRKDARIAAHRHAWWDMAILREGRMEYREGDRVVTPARGDLVVFPSDVEHRWRALETPLVLESFMISVSAEDEAGERAVERMRRRVEAEGFRFRLGPAVRRRREEFWREATAGGDGPLVGDRLGLLLQLLFVEILPDAFGDSLDSTSRRFSEEVGQASANAKLAARMQEYLRNHLDEKITGERLEVAFGYSKRHLNRIFRHETGCSVQEFLFRKRIAAACDLLVNTDARTNEVAYRTGFSDVSYFCKVFRGFTHFTPQHYKREHRG